MVDRHSILRTVFISRPETGGFVQVLLKSSTASVKMLTASSNNDLLKLICSLDEAQLPSSQPPHVFSIYYASNTGQDIMCRLDISHALIDALSMEVIIRDLSAAYAGNELSPAPSFRQLIEYLHSSSVSESNRLQYWKQYLTNLQPCHVDLLNKESSPSTKRNYVELPAHVTQGIDEFCRKKGHTRSVFIQVAWALTLSRLIGMDEICFGYLASGRDVPIDNINETVGTLVNILVSRVDLAKPLEEIVATTREDSISSLEYQHTSLANIQHALGLGGTQSLFNTIMSVREVWRFGQSPMTNALVFEDVGGDDPHEVKIIFPCCHVHQD